MPHPTKTKFSVASFKRKADIAKEKPSRVIKKPKIDTTQSKSQPVKINKPVSKKLKVSVQPELSEEGSDSVNEDGGVALEDVEDSDEEIETSLPTVNQGVHPDRVKANGNGAGPNGTSSREAHAKQKQLVAERKASKPLADQLARTKKIWERLRRKSHVPLEERKKLVEELFDIITGNIKDYVLKHDSVRVVQTAIKYANPDQRRLIARELKGTYRQLAESRYAKFLIGKLLVQGDDEVRDIIVPEFFGNVRRLIKHPEASWILDDVYRGVATGQQKATILREWYGAEFALFQKDNKGKISGNLADVLAEDPGKRAPVMRSLQELINHLIQKRMTAFTLLHDAMLQYFLNCKPGTEEITDYIDLIKGDEEGDLLKNLAFTKSGAQVVSLALAHGTAKDRKHILKAFKNTFQLMAADQNAHLVILTAYEVVDDTVLSAKTIFPELLGKVSEEQIENVLFLSNDLVARISLLYLFRGRSASLFPANLSPDLAILSDVDSIRTITSKKDPEVRRQELVKALSQHLLTAITSVAPKFISTSFGCQFVVDVLFSAEGDKSAALQEIASAASGDPNASPSSTTVEADEDAINTHDNTPPQIHVAQTPFGGKMLKALIAGGRYDSKLKKVISTSPGGPLNFADIFYPIIKPHILAWATGSSSFVVLSLLETEYFSSKEALKQTLKKDQEILQRVATEETKEQKSVREEEAQVFASDVAGGTEDAKKGKGKRGKKVVRERPVGNLGTRMVLEMLG